MLNWIVILLLLGAGIWIGIIATIIILRKDVFQVINYHNGMPDIEDVEMSPAINLMTEKNAKLDNLHIYLNRIERATYPEDYEKTRAEVVYAIKAYIWQLHESAELFNHLLIDINKESAGLKLE